MTSYEVPDHLQLYADVIRALPIPGDVMTVEAHQEIVDLLRSDMDKRKPKLAAVEDEKPADERGTGLHRGGHLADSSKSRTPVINEPDTIAFGFGRRRNW